MDLGQLLGGMAPSLGFGGAAGLVVGYAAKKLTKLLALLLGATFILLQLLAYKGYISIDWGAMEHDTQALLADPSGAGLGDRLWNVIAANLPFGGGFAAGFAIGLKLG